MRIDKFLNAVNITKSRTISSDMCKSKAILINDKVATPSKEVKVGDVLTISLLKGAVRYEVLQLPATKSTKKSDKDLYIRALG